MTKIWGVLLVVALVHMQYRLWAAPGSVPHVIGLQNKVEQKEAELAILKKRNDALDAEIAFLKLGDESLEERARSELGLIRPGETFYLIVANQ